jgi:hypothetical protein
LSDHVQGVDIGGSGEDGVTVPDIRAYTRDTGSFAAPGRVSVCFLRAFRPW